jgi:hypothetical protein
MTVLVTYCFYASEYDNQLFLFSRFIMNVGDYYDFARVTPRREE